MNYDFVSSLPLMDKLVFALCLNKEKRKERILIGTEQQINLRLEKNSGELYYDETRPLGTFLVEFESDPQRTWTTNAMHLIDTYDKLFLKDKAVVPYRQFLEQKYSEQKSVAMYSAMQTWENYLRCYNQNHGQDLFISSTATLYRAFHASTENYLYGKTIPPTEQINPTDKIPKPTFFAESQIEVWYPNEKMNIECAVIHQSFRPLMLYYFKRLEEWNLTFQQCKICSIYFLAKSKHYELCSKKCRGVQSKENKRDFDKRAKEQDFERSYTNAYGYWSYRIRKLQKNTRATPEEITLVQTAFTKFRGEAVVLKNKVKHRELEQTAFDNWLFEQMDIVDELMENILEKQ